MKIMTNKAYKEAIREECCKWQSQEDERRYFQQRMEEFDRRLSDLDRRLWDLQCKVDRAATPTCTPVSTCIPTTATTANP